MKLYFDTNIYNRIFDDQNQIRIRFETMAINIIFELVEKGMHSLVWSFILEDENRGNPYSNRRKYIKTISNVCTYSVGPDSKIRDLAYNIMNNSNTKAKDSLHLASAIYAGCNYFITCDDKFIKTINSNSDRLINIIGTIKLLNPIDFLREEMNIDVVE